MDEMYDYWLHNIQGIGSVTIKKILEMMTAKELYFCIDLKNIKFLKDNQRKQLELSKETWDMEGEWEGLKKRNINFLVLGKEGYPKKLSKIYDPPQILYHKGNLNCFLKPTVAVIGARACSSYGSLAAKELGRELAKAGIVVVSGMARGIDGICQWSALEQGGESIGVLGSGVEVCYPKENRPLYERLQREGCILSENPPFTAPKAGLFPLRNRIISGLADMIVVIESGEKSGTLITVDMALEQGKEVYAMPGRITDPVSRGCNKLIKQGAGMILSPREFVEEVCPLLQIKYQKEEKMKFPKLKNEEKKILEILDVSWKTMEEIYQAMKKEDVQISLGKVMELVLEMRMKKILEEENGYFFSINYPLQ